VCRCREAEAAELLATLKERLQLSPGGVETFSRRLMAMDRSGAGKVRAYDARLAFGYAGMTLGPQEMGAL
jgi:hypothetical protein